LRRCRRGQQQNDDDEKERQNQSLHCDLSKSARRRPISESRDLDENTILDLDARGEIAAMDEKSEKPGRP